MRNPIFVIPINCKEVSFRYRNWRGIERPRRIQPTELWFGTTSYHPEKQWFLGGEDLARGAARDFALKDIVFADFDRKPDLTIFDEIKMERGRQIGKGFNAAHDDEHGNGDLARAAAAFALHSVVSTYSDKGSRQRALSKAIMTWPWNNYPFNPGAPREALVKAGALIVAEIERLDRKDAKKDPLEKAMDEVLMAIGEMDPDTLTASFFAEQQRESTDILKDQLIALRTEVTLLRSGCSPPANIGRSGSTRSW